MIRKWNTVAFAVAILVSAVPILSGCSQPSTNSNVPAEPPAGLTAVPPRPVPTQQPSTPTSGTPPEESQDKAPSPTASSDVQPSQTLAAVKVPLTETQSGATTGTDSTNYLPEATWEEGYPGWQQDGSVAIRTDDKVKLFGARSLRFDLAKSKGFNLVRWEVAKGEVKVGDRFLLKGYLKTEDVDPQADVRLTALAMDSKTDRKFWFHSLPYHGTQGWTEVEVRVGIPTGCDALAVRLDYAQDPKKPAKGGTIWLDDVSLTRIAEDAEEPINTLLNGDFDAFTSHWIDLPDARHMASDTVEKQVRGSASLRIDLNGLDKLNITQWIAGIKPDTVYRLDGFMKLSEVDGNAFLTTVAENSQLKNKSWIATEKLHGTSGWRKLSLQLKTAANTDSLGIRVDYQPEKAGSTATGGTVWVDNLALTEVQ